MSGWRRVGFWLLCFAGFIIFLLVFRDILLPFVAGMALAYALDPLADWLERGGLGRLASTLTILIFSILVLVLVLVLIAPVLAKQLVAFIEGLPTYARELQELAGNLLDSRAARFLGIDPATIQDSLGGLLSESAGWLAGLLVSLWSGGQALLSILSLFIITPIVAFYLLYDWDRLVASVDSWLPRDHVEEIRCLAREMDDAIAAFVRGQGLVCIVLGTFYATSLAIIGLNFGLLIGFGAGLIGFIPFVGAAVGFIVSVSVALVQFAPDWLPIIATASIFIIGQMLENYVLQPRLIGENVGLHPVWIIFSLLAFGLLFGFVGVMIAIPTAAAMGVLVRYALHRYLESPIYRGRQDGTAPD